MTRLSLLVALALVAGGLAAVPPAAAGGWCTWNPEFTDPIEAVAPVHFNDGPICTVTLFPCPHDPSKSCAPRGPELP